MGPWPWFRAKRAVVRTELQLLAFIGDGDCRDLKNMQAFFSITVRFFFNSLPIGSVDRLIFNEITAENINFPTLFDSNHQHIILYFLGFTFNRVLEFGCI